ncbi:MAG: hypothetical protein IMY80_03390, partial [Chloroflexi bacterium]|nr:hypothetical protein [Chloroflexota bacterium]
MNNDLNNENNSITDTRAEQMPITRRNFLLMGLAAFGGAIVVPIASDTWDLLKTEVGDVWRS